MRWLALVMCFTLLGCKGDGDGNGLQPCGPAGECPAGFECNPVDNLCYLSGTLTDAGVDALGPAPETVLSVTPAARTRDANARFEFSGGATQQCRLDTGDFALCTSPLLTTVFEGVHTFEVAAVSALGVADPTPATWSWEVDQTGPTVVLDGPGEGATSGTSVTFTYTAEAGATFLCSLDSPTLAACAGPSSSYTLLAGGDHTFRVQARDDLGNDGPLLVRAWVVDATGPTVTINPFPSNESLSSGTVTYTSDPGSTFLCALDGAAYGSCPATGFAFSGLSPGGHDISVRATDTAGNTGGATTYSWVVLGPIVVFLLPDGVPVAGATVVFHRANGTVIGTATTDAAGMAMGNGRAGGMVTAAYADRTFFFFYTATSVQPPTTVRLGFISSGPPTGATVNATWPGFAPGGCCTMYTADLGLNARMTVSGAAAPPPPASVGVLDVSYDTAGDINVLGSARGNFVAYYSWLKGLNVPANQTVAVTLPAWSAAVQTSATITHILQPNLRPNPLVAEAGVWLNGVSYQAEDIFTNSSPDDSEGFTFGLPPTAFSATRWFKARYLANPIFKEMLTTESFLIDVNNFLPSILADTIDKTVPERPRVAWTADPDLGTADGGYLALVYPKGTDPITFHVWYVTLPRTLSFQLPALPASLSMHAPIATTTYTGILQFVDASTVGNYAQFLTASTRLVGGDLTTTTLFTPYIPSAPYTARWTHRTMTSR